MRGPDFCLVVIMNYSPIKRDKFSKVLIKLVFPGVVDFVF